MPGGGIGGIIGGLVGGMGGPGGMGGMGGMGGPGGMGGMGGMTRMANPNGQNQANAGNMQMGEADVYDVDRWKRADGMDAPTSNVQMVRDAWDRKDAEKKEKSLLNKSKNKVGKLLSKKKSSEEHETTIPETRPVGGTIHTAEMKKAERNLMTEEEQKQADAEARKAAAALLQRQVMPAERKPYNYLGLQTPSQIESFFTSNPLNSVILAVDNLSMGVLSLNQVQATAGRDNLSPGEIAGRQMMSRENTEESPVVGAAGADMGRNVNARSLSGMQSGVKGNLIAQQAGTDYMNMVRENRENKKYDVHIV